MAIRKYRFTLLALIITANALMVALFVNFRVQQLEQKYINRLEPLIQDSLKMHSWYHNWEASYQEQMSTVKGYRLKKLKD